MPDRVLVDHASCPSPIGILGLFARAGKLVAVAFEGGEAESLAGLKRRFEEVEIRETRDPAGAVSALARYFAGHPDALDAVPLDSGGTSFQRRVWSSLRKIPSGTTASYGQVAARIGQPTAVRAVAQANAQNPVPLFIPCHRVIAATGDLHGYGGGLLRKKRLLELEGALRADGPDLFGPIG